MADTKNPIIEPKCDTLVSLSENGDGMKLWEFSTRYDLDTVLKDNFFRMVGRHGLQRLDRIHVSCDTDSDTVTVAELVVTSVKAGWARAVLRKGSKQTIECEPRSPFELLGLMRNATDVDIQAAYRKKARECHPDVPGGSAEKFRAVEQARDDCLLIVTNKAA